MPNAADFDSRGVFHAENYRLASFLNENVGAFRAIFTGDDTINYRFIETRGMPSVRCCAIFADGMVDSAIMNDSIIRPLTRAAVNSGAACLDEIEFSVIQGNQVERSGDLDKMVSALLYGDTILFADGFADGLIINSKGWPARSISEPDDEKALRGPREGFTEAILQNTSMIRRKIQTSDLKFAFQSLGTRTNTKLCFVYLDSVVDHQVLEELKRRLKKIDIDGPVSSNTITEFIRDSPYSLFKTVGASEKPDIVASKLLEGRVALILDGSPLVLTVPYLFIENLQSPDDYYVSFYYGSIGRILRFLAFFLTITIPAFYIALVNFHQEMIPASLLYSLITAAKGVPFPTVVECVGMLLMFEILRETGIRMSDKIGQALSIVGALVVGQAAVEAKIVSAPTVIIVAFTAITGLMAPRMKAAGIICRFAALAAASFIGIYGFFLFMITLLIYLFGIRSFGVEYMSQLLSFTRQDMKDMYVRAPLPMMETRPAFITKERRRRGI